MSVGSVQSQSGLCDPNTPFFAVDLTGQPNGTWVSNPPVQREGNCCNTNPPDKCIEFEITLDPNTIAIDFSIASGAVPGGALFYQINCGPQTPIGTPLCLSGVGPHILTFCKPGNNQNTYQITAIAAPDVSPDDTTAFGCSAEIYSSGVELTGITWTSIAPGNQGDYDGFLSCTVGCDTTLVTPSGTYPPFVDYQLCGVPLAGPCYPEPLFCDTVRVYLSPPMVVTVNPDPASYCTDSAGVSLDVNATGGLAPYVFNWYDPGGALVASDTDSYFAIAPGTYTIEVFDANFPDCPPVTHTFNVALDPAPIVDAGPDLFACAIAPTTNINGTVTNSPGGIWSGAGTFGNTTSLSTTYTPTAAEISAGFAEIVLTSTGHLTCSPVSDTLILNLLPDPIVTFNATEIVCFGELTDIEALVGGTNTPYAFNWNTGDITSLITDQGPGTYTVTVTDGSPAACQTTESITITENPEIIITANDVNIVSCNANAQVPISVSGGSGGDFTYLWSTGDTNDTIVVGPGTYFVTAFDTLGCTDVDTVLVTTSASNLNVVVSQPATVCYGDSALLTPLVSGGVAPYTYLWGTGETTSTVTKPAGTYCVTVTDDVSCVAQYCVTINEADSLFVNLDDPILICNGTSTVITANVGGGTPGYTYSWSTTDNTQSILAGPGTYSVQVTDNNANACTASDTTVVIQGSLLTLAMDSTSVSCFGLNDGTADVSASGSFSPYTYLWETGSVSDSISGLGPDFYTVTVTDSIGCTAVDSIEVIEPPFLTLTILSQTNVSCFGGSDGSASVQVNGGFPPYSYSWSPIANTNTSASGLSAGTYIVTVTDKNFCIASVTITITEPDLLEAQIIQNEAVSCFGGSDGGAVASAIGGTAPYNYNWPFNNDTDSSNLNVFPIGTYTVNVTDDNGCTASTTVTITQPTPLSVQSNAIDVTCFGFTDGVLEANPTGGTSPYFYSWDPFQGNIDTVNNVAPGTYTLVVGDANGCQDTAVLTVGEPMDIFLSTTGLDSYCGQDLGEGTVIVDSGGVANFSYLWDLNANGQTTQTAINLFPGTYSVTVTDANSCEQTASVTIGNIPPGTATIGASTNASCNGSADGTATVSMSGTGTAPYTYDWFDAASGISLGQTGQTATGLSAGTYYVVVTDANGCVSTSNTVLISEPTALSLVSGQTDASCFGFCDGTATVSVTGGTAPYFYSWDDPLMQNNAQATQLCAGNFVATVTDANGCIITQNFTITEPNQLFLDTVVVNANCGQNDGSACVSVFGGTGPYNYQWSNGANTTCITNIVGGSYPITVTDANNCIISSIADVQDLTGPIAFISNQTDASCHNSCDGSAQVDIQGGYSQIMNVFWSTNTGGQTTPLATGLCAGMYSVNIVDSLGCTSSTTVTIDAPNPLQINLLPTTPTCNGFCDGAAQVFTFGGTSPYTFQWSVTGANVIGTTNSVSGLCAGTYTLSITDANGCTADTTFILIDPAPVQATTGATDALCFGSCNGSISVVPQVGVAPFSYQWDAATGNQVGQSAVGLCAGQYSVTVTDANGCTLVLDDQVIEPTALGIAFTDTGNVDCAGASNGFIEVTPSGGTAGYTYAWSDGSTGQINIGLDGGTYCATITDANGCQISDCINITEPSALQISAFAVDASCHGYCDGELLVNTNGGTFPYQVQWNAPGFPTNAYVQNLCVGNYSVTVTDANGCTADSTLSISQPTAISVSSINTDANCGQNNGEICASATGGTGGYQFAWDDPNLQVGTCASNLLSGCYTLTVTDANYCDFDTILCINDINGPVASLIQATDALCFGSQDGTLDFQFNQGTAPFNTSLSIQGGAQIGAGGTSFSNLDVGCYNFTVTDAAGCISSVSQCISEPADITSQFGNIQNVSCTGQCDGQAEVNAWGGTAPYSYAWTNGNNPGNSLNTGLCAGVQNVTITDANNCIHNTSVTIIDPNPLLLNLTATNNLCNGDCQGIIQAQTSGGTLPYTYAWTNTTGTGNMVSGLCAGNYSLQVTDGNGCTVSSTETITEPAALTLSINATDPTCSVCNGIGDAIVNGGTAPYTYNWFGSGNNPTASLNDGLCPGTTNLEVTDINGCQISASTSLVDSPPPVITGFNVTDALCFGSSDGTAEVLFSNPSGSPVNNFLWDANATGQTTQTATGLAAGNYCVTITDNNGCDAINCTTIDEPTELIGVPLGADTLCFGEGTVIFAGASGGTMPYTINWDAATGFGNQAGGINVVPFTSTSYCYEVVDANGCTSANTCIDIEVLSDVNLAPLSDFEYCDGDTADIIAIASGGAGNYNFTWVDENGQVIFSEISDDSSSLTVSPSSDETFYLVVDDGCSSLSIDSSVVTVNPNPNFYLVLSDSIGCAPMQIDFDFVGSDMFQFNLNIGCDSVSEYIGLNQSQTLILTEPGIHPVCASVTSAEGCTTSSDSASFIEVWPQPDADFFADPNVADLLDTEIEFINQSSGANNYEWSFGDGTVISGFSGPVVGVANTNGTYTNPSYIYPSIGQSYNVQLVATNQYGCTDTAIQTLEIKDIFLIYVPNAFTPDDDGLNETFLPVLSTNNGIRNYEFWVFDRWGEVVYYTEQVGAAWDGTYRGFPSKTDVYVWKVKLRDFEGKPHEFVGHVTLLK